ncbi:hypothetical protein EV421DRAFT_2023695 [Armillaria borealis]|uniref:DUF6697 domain-containing protein n=1 Tax=Armillaria borealis TaxID=47425 RepID=A0AA39IYU5_9AGAR|nr:hypothetical protein EV421DRAFT_2023695 [Armillaria borealis]
MWMWMLGTSFAKFVRDEYTLEEVRDYFNWRLQREYPDVFIFGRFVTRNRVLLSIAVWWYPPPQARQWSMIQEYMTNCREMPLIFDGAECAIYGAGLVQHHTFMYSPLILAVCMAHMTTPPNVSLELPVREGMARYSFTGIVYNHGNAHFTARYLMHPGSFSSMTVWLLRPTPPSTLKSQSMEEAVPDIINLIDDDDDDTVAVSTSKGILPASEVVKIEPSEATVGVLSTPASTSVRSTRNVKKRRANTDSATTAALNDDSDTRPHKRTRNAHPTAGSSQDLTARIETVGSASTSSESLSHAALNIDGPFDDEFDPNNMAFELTEPETDTTDPQRDHSVSPGATKPGRQPGGPPVAEADPKSEDDFYPSDLLSVDDGFHEDASRSKKRKVSALARSTHLSEIARGKKKAVPRPLTKDDYLTQIKSVHLKNAKQYTINPPPPAGFYVPRIFVSNIYGGSSMQSMQKLTAFDIQCIWPTKDLNPLVVDSPGAPGLLFTSRPEIVGGTPWHVFCRRQVEKQLRWEYAGKYTMVVSGKIEAEQFAAQTEATKKRWGDYLVTRKEARVYVAMRVQIMLRKHGQPLDERRVCMEIEAVMGRAVEKPGDEGMTKEDKQKERGKIKARVPLTINTGDVIKAFCNGDEHINILRMDCIGYDHTFVRDLAKVGHCKHGRYQSEWEMMVGSDDGSILGTNGHHNDKPHVKI